MILTTEQIQKGHDALKTYVEQMLNARGQGWEEMFIPDSVYTTGAQDVLMAATRATDQSVTGRQTAGQAALRAALDSTGQGSQVSDAEVAAAVTAILKTL